MLIIISITFSFLQFNSSCIPPVLTCYINIVPDPIDTTLVDITQQDFITTFNYSVTIQRGTLYNVTGFGGNAIGNGSTTTSMKWNFIYHFTLYFCIVNGEILPSFTTSVTGSTTSSLLPSATADSNSAAGMLVYNLMSCMCFV